MINSIIHSWLNSKQLLLNERLNTSIKLNLVRSASLERLPSSDKYINYELFIADIVPAGFEARNNFICNARMHFIFQFTERNQEVYKEKFDRYLFELYRLFNSSRQFTDSDISQQIILNEFSARIVNGDNFEGDYYLPEMEIQFKGYDYSLAQTGITENIIV